MYVVCKILFAVIVFVINVCCEICMCDDCMLGVNSICDECACEMCDKYERDADHECECVYICVDDKCESILRVRALYSYISIRFTYLID